MSDRFVLSEGEVLQLVGCTAADLKKVRAEHLTCDEHFVRKSRRFWFSEEGLKAILAVFGAKAADAADLAEKSAPAVAGDASGQKKADLVVERCCPNPIWVQCRVGAELVNVRVYDNRRMVRGTRLTGCRFMAGRWAWDGRRLAG